MRRPAPLVDSSARAYRQYRVSPPTTIGNSSTVTRLWGALIFVGAIVLFVCGMWAMVLSKLFPRTGIEILDAVREDRYYCFLIPLTIVPTMIAVYLNWVGMMFFRHN